MINIAEDLEKQNQLILDYYKFQSKIYDFTRWLFLFGRDAIIMELTKDFGRNEKLRILEVGVGTARNIIKIRKMFPNAQIDGIELSSEMYEKAIENCTKLSIEANIVNADFITYKFDNKKYDVILFSYVFTMLGSISEVFIEKSRTLLKEDGKIAVVDFHQTKNVVYSNFMKSKNINLEGKIASELKANYNTKLLEIKKAYFGIWEYYLFIGKNK